MMMECVWWELAPEDPDIRTLQRQLDEVDLTVWQQINALQAKYWIMNDTPPQWGAVMLWSSDKPDLTELPLNIAAESIGRQPDVRFKFSVTASCSNEAMTTPWAYLVAKENACINM
ncbi:MAG: hypothetical protein ACRCYF_17785 [Shewanella sp.]